MTYALTPHDLYAILGVITVEAGWVDGCPTSPEVPDLDSFKELAEHLRAALTDRGVPVSDEAIPRLTYETDGCVPDKYVTLHQ